MVFSNKKYNIYLYYFIYDTGIKLIQKKHRDWIETGRGRKQVSFPDWQSQYVVQS